MRLRRALASLLFAGCVVPSNSPPPQYGYNQQPPPNYQQPPPTQVQPQPTQPQPTQPEPPPPQPQPPPPPEPTQPVFYDEPGDFTVDEKSRQIYLTEEGHEHAEALLFKAGLIAVVMTRFAEEVCPRFSNAMRKRGAAA